MFRSVLIANRGEIVVRVARTARRLGVETIAIASDVDRNAPHVRACDRVVAIGGERAADSYLRIDRIVAAARAAGADAVHPGYGFLSESAAFAEAVLAAGLAWIGPPPATMRAMADKAEARRRMAAAKVPVLAGYDEAAQDRAALRGAAARIGFPLMVKAAAGGGGRGMRLVAHEAELDAALDSAAAEAGSAFGDARLLLERAVVDARHVEIQVFADTCGGVIHLGERDCSVQRRHQKIIEEAPSPAVSPVLRRRMGEVAVAVAREVGYVGAGTVEFLLDRDGAFTFMEMNTRLQVEHAVTEALVGADLVEWQLRIACGEPLPMTQDEALARFEAGGHAIEARLCAEDPAIGFLPQSGRVVRWSAPPLVRCDHALASGANVSAFYDSMLGKLISHALTRAGAAAQLADALDRTVCLGVTTNRGFLVRVLRHPAFGAGDVTTGFLDAHFGADAARAGAAPSGLEALAAAALALLPHAHLPALWADWSSTRIVDRDVPIVVAETLHTWHLTGTRDAFDARSEAAAHRIEAIGLRHVNAAGGEIDATIDGRLVRAVFARDGEQSWWLADGAEIAVVDAQLRSRTSRAATASGALLAPMHGRVVQVLVAPGGAVEAGALLLVLEAMKMEHQIRAPHAGVVLALHARAGDQVAARQRLIEMQA
ncbi:MAG TPA: biotin carboxylase N-terminal domain-containing protein [Caldimonas sp.]|nr:biotin carboxylase N-terminal domain-containing protein [Caldimonas sp.]